VKGIIHLTLLISYCKVDLNLILFLYLKASKANHLCIAGWVVFCSSLPHCSASIIAQRLNVSGSHWKFQRLWSLLAPMTFPWTQCTSRNIFSPFVAITSPQIATRVCYPVAHDASELFIYITVYRGPIQVNPIPNVLTMHTIEETGTPWGCAEGDKRSRWYVFCLGWSGQHKKRRGYIIIEGPL